MLKVVEWMTEIRKLSHFELNFSTRLRPIVVIIADDYADDCFV